MYVHCTVYALQIFKKNKKIQNNKYKFELQIFYRYNACLVFPKIGTE